MKISKFEKWLVDTFGHVLGSLDIEMIVEKHEEEK